MFDADVKGRAKITLTQIKDGPPRREQFGAMLDSSLRALVDRTVPRYTSYPTAPRVSADVDADVHAGWLATPPDAARETLPARGYRRIGIDHFARPDDPLARAKAARTRRRDFQGYTTDRAEVPVGVGASSIGRLSEGYVQNEGDIATRAAAIDAGRFAVAKRRAVTALDRSRGDVSSRRLCFFDVDLAETAARHGFDAAIFADDIEKLTAPRRVGCVAITDGRVAILSEGPRLACRRQRLRCLSFSRRAPFPRGLNPPSRVVVVEDAPARALDIVVLAGLQRPEEGEEPDEAEADRGGDEEEQNGHGATRLAGRIGGPGRVPAGRRAAIPPSVAPIRSRSALSVTAMEEPDMASAATSGLA